MRPGGSESGSLRGFGCVCRAGAFSAFGVSGFGVWRFFRVVGGFTLWVFRFRALDLELLKLGTQWMLDFEMRGVDLRVRSEWVVS